MKTKYRVKRGYGCWFVQEKRGLFQPWLIRNTWAHKDIAEVDVALLKRKQLK